MVGRISRSVRSLTTTAVALGAGERMTVPPVHFREAAEVACALNEAASLLSERTTALQATNQSLLASETRFRATFEQAAVGMASSSCA